MSIKINYSLFFTLLCFSSCKMDWTEPIIVIRNDSRRAITVAETPDSKLSDNTIKKTQFTQFIIDPGEVKEIYLPNVSLKDEPDSSVSNLFFFDTDSLAFASNIKYQGLSNRFVLKHVVLQLNKIKKPLDTIYFKPGK